MRLKTPPKPDPSFISLTRNDIDNYEMRQKKLLPSPVRYRPNYGPLSPQSKQSDFSKVTNESTLKQPAYKADLRLDLIRECGVPENYDKIIELMDSQSQKRQIE